METIKKLIAVRSFLWFVAFAGLIRDSRGQIIIRPDKQVTRILQPLDKTGHVDYVEAVNQRYSQRVTTATNWEVPLTQAFGPPDLTPQSLAEYWQRLGIQPITRQPDESFLSGYRTGKEYSELDNKACESFFNSHGPWTAAKFPHEARWLGMRKDALDRLVDASQRPRNYVPQVTSEEDHRKVIQQVQSFFRKRTQSKDPAEKLAASLGQALTSGWSLRAAPLSRIQGGDSNQNNRELARMLHRRALLRIGEGDNTGAQSDLLAIHRIGWLTGQGNLVNWITGQAVEEMASTGDLDLVESGKLTRAECKQYLESLQQLPSHRKATELLDVELRYQSLDALQFAAIHHEAMLRQLSDVGEVDKLALSRIQALDWSEVMRQVNRLVDKQLALLSTPEQQAKLRNWEDGPAKEPDAQTSIERAQTGQEELTEYMAQIYFHQTSPRWLRRIESRPQNRHRVVQAGLAAELYRFEHGTYPQSLEALQPMVNEPLVDVMTGEPFQLKPFDKGVLIYSLGLNGTDEGGVDIARLGSWSGTGPTPDDIAVRLERP